MNTSSSSAEADPTALPAHDYHLVVGPALKVTAALAARRGDPTLYNDMASMMALLALVRALRDSHLASGRADASAEAMAQAPLGACAMVLQDAELDENQKRDCLWALDAAEDQLRAKGVLNLDEPRALEAYTSLAEGARETGEQILAKMAEGLVDAIDAWERESG